MELESERIEHETNKKLSLEQIGIGCQRIFTQRSDHDHSYDQAQKNRKKRDGNILGLLVPEIFTKNFFISASPPS